MSLRTSMEGAVRTLQEKDGVLKDVGLLVFRVGLSASVFAAHGMSKVGNILTGNWDFPDPMGVGPELSLILSAGAESVCAVLVALGIWARISAIPLIFTMVVAVWIINGGTSFLQQEKSFVYLLGWTLILFAGSGRYTIGYAIRRWRGRG